LALSGKERECACEGLSTMTVWEPRKAHPKTFMANEATDEVLRAVLRAEEHCPTGDALMKGAPGELGLYIVKAQRAWKGNILGAMRAMVVRGGKAMPPGCPLFARKIAAEGVDAWGQLLKPVFRTALHR